MEEDVDDLNDLAPNIKLAVYHLSKLYETRDDLGWIDSSYSSFVSETHEYIRGLVVAGTVEFKSADYCYLKDIQEYLLEQAFRKRFPESLNI
jgi:hypothetical protein